MNPKKLSAIHAVIRSCAYLNGFLHFRIRLHFCSLHQQTGVSLHFIVEFLVFTKLTKAFRYNDFSGALPVALEPNIFVTVQPHCSFSSAEAAVTISDVCPARVIATTNSALQLDVSTDPLSKQELLELLMEIRSNATGYLNSQHLCLHRFE